MKSYPVIPVRWQKDAPRVVNTLTLSPDHQLVDSPCATCDLPIMGNESCSLVAVGPDPSDAEDMERHEQGRWYSANGVMTHQLCADSFDPGSLILGPD